MNSLFVAWRPPTSTQTGWRPVGRLEHGQGLFRFWHTQGAKKPGFHPFAGMTDLNQVYESGDLFPLFANRLLSRSRPEFETYLRWSDFDIRNPPDALQLLGVTEGLRQTDYVELFPCPTLDVEGSCFNKFFLHGIGWMPDATLDRINRLEPKESLKILLDLQNEYDPHAVAVCTEQDHFQIGYLPRYLARDVRQLLKECDVNRIELQVDRINRDAPMQNRVLCQIRSYWPSGFRPCSGEDFAPIPVGVPVRLNS